MDASKPGSKNDRGRRGLGTRGGKAAKRRARKGKRAGAEGVVASKVRSRKTVLEEEGDGADPDCLWYAKVARVQGNRQWLATLVPALDVTTDLYCAIEEYAHKPKKALPAGHVLVTARRRKGKRDAIYTGTLVLVQLDALKNVILEVYTEAELRGLKQEVPRSAIESATDSARTGGFGGAPEGGAGGGGAFEFDSDCDDDDVNVNDI